MGVFIEFVLPMLVTSLLVGFGISEIRYRLKARAFKDPLRSMRLVFRKGKTEHREDVVPGNEVELRLPGQNITLRLATRDLIFVTVEQPFTVADPKKHRVVDI